MEQNKKIRLGDLLVERGRVSEAQLQEALSLQSKTHKQLGSCLMELGYITDNDIADVLHLQLGIPRVSLRGIEIEADLVGSMNGAVLRKHNVLPIEYSKDYANVLILAMSNPLDIAAQDDIAMISNCEIEPRIATVSEINTVLDKYFGSSEAMSAAQQYAREREAIVQQLEQQEASQQAELENAPIVQLVRTIVEQAVRQRASDIHIDALEKRIRVRYRIDGSLVEQMLYDINLLSAVVARIKIMGEMDIAERRKPQDGHINMVIDRISYDIRVSVLPSVFGEKVVMRIASATALMKKKTELGMRSEELDVFNRMLKHPNGILLVTGPTGSGKSTTLYASLAELNKEDVNIITVEDPIEGVVPGVNQVQVNEKAELTFASALRSILRQDPDIIMIGEIRDYETASIAVRASITGHFVASTLHTNSSSATVSRLLDMGVESYMLADSLIGVVAQRLIRRLCTSCAESHMATESEKLMLGVDVDEEIEIKEACGCPLCSNTGYYGRIGVFEMLEMGPEIQRVIAKNGSTSEIRDVAVENGMSTLKMSAAHYVKEGMTTISEMMKVAYD
ncbi:MAG: ATPase, T2SS/T4P/T4SS family [Lachnospiraceae bacterium]